MEHLATLDLDLDNKMVLEVGCGIGLLTGFFEKRGCEVWSTDGRAENVQENLARHPYRRGRVFVSDLATPKSHHRFDCFKEKPFQIVFCYGVLYHLADPALCIANLAQINSGLFLLETCVNPIDNGQINPADEDGKQLDQSLNGAGCRPGRDWVMAELRKHYPHVYLTATQPAHKLYPTCWPAGSEQGIVRAVFVASHTELPGFNLSTGLLTDQGGGI
jgi:SAM-dependent methyltransferase